MNDVEKTVIGIRENLEKYPAVHEQTAFLVIGVTYFLIRCLFKIL
jgi:hypothetical protein